MASANSEKRLKDVTASGRPKSNPKYKWKAGSCHSRCLYATMQQTERILELSDERLDDRESRALLAEIFEKYLYIEANEYRHNWALGDLVVWDNMAMQHARKPCPLSEGARSFRRVAVCEAGNGITDTVEFLNLRDASHAFS